MHGPKEPGDTPRIAAAINASPESFFAGSVASTAKAVGEAAAKAEREGAEMIDIGAASTAPYGEARISEELETNRMRVAVSAARAATSLPISADTQHAAVARAALDAGATLVNDVSGLAGDPAMGALCAERNAGVILMANETDGLDEAGESPIRVVRRLLEAAVSRAESAGIPRERLVVDPGIGFFRRRSIPWHEWDIAVLGEIEWLRTLGLPILVGASRKSFIGHLLGRDLPAERLAGSLAVAIYCACQGVAWVRVHDVAETQDALRMTRMLYGCP